MESSRYIKFIDKDITFTKKECEKTLKDFEFQGFKAERIFEKMYAANSNEKDWSGVLERDMMVLGIVVTTRGTKVSKFNKTIGVDAERELNDLIRKYKITGTATPGKEDVTLSRTVAIFPAIVGYAFMRSGAKPKIGTGWDQHRVPKGFSLPCVAGIFPPNELGVELLNMHKLVIKAFYIQINRKKADYNKAIEYQLMQFENSAGSLEIKMKWCRDMGFIDGKYITFTYEGLKNVLAITLSTANVKDNNNLIKPGKITGENLSMMGSGYSTTEMEKSFREKNSQAKDLGGPLTPSKKISRASSNLGLDK